MAWLSAAEHSAAAATDETGHGSAHHGLLGDTHMRELRLIGVHDDGEHLLLAGSEDSEERLVLAIDDALRAAVRRMRHRPSADVGSVPVPDELRPRDVQALLRAGVSVDDVAERAGWTTEKVLRYEGPIRAEREHIAGVARGLAVSGGSAGRTDSTFGQRVERRVDGHLQLPGRRPPTTGELALRRARPHPGADRRRGTLARRGRERPGPAL